MFGAFWHSVRQEIWVSQRKGLEEVQSSNQSTRNPPPPIFPLHTHPPTYPPTPTDRCNDCDDMKDTRTDE
jgi:hypothetical protein